jgi:hypothetical protein
MKRCVAITLCLLCIGCKAFELPRYDPMTVYQIKVEISNVEMSYQWVVQIISEIDPDNLELEQMKLVYESDLVRLEQWLKYEEAKNLQDNPQ